MPGLCPGGGGFARAPCVCRVSRARHTHTPPIQPPHPPHTHTVCRFRPSRAQLALLHETPRPALHAERRVLLVGHPWLPLKNFPVVLQVCACFCSTEPSLSSTPTRSLPPHCPPPSVSLPRPPLTPWECVWVGGGIGDAVVLSGGQSSIAVLFTGPSGARAWCPCGSRIPP